MRNTKLTLLLAAFAASTGSTAAAQTPRAPTIRSYAYFGSGDPDRAMLGVTTSPGGRRDTLGLLIESITPGGPADKAGLEEGNRLQSINGVNLKLSRDDADDPEMYGVSQNRLMREMGKVKPGDEVTLEVWGGSRARTVRIKTVAARALTEDRGTMATLASRNDDRAAIGVMLSATGSKRDTAGVFVDQVVSGGPAEKAGIIEGDRIASINGVDVRVAREDAGDASASSARIDRLAREVQKLKPGETADLLVVSGGRSHTVKVTAGRAGDVNGPGFGFGFGGDGTMRVFGAPGAGAGGMIIGPNGGTRVMPRVRVDGGTIDSERIRTEIEDNLQRLRGIGPEVRAEVQDNLDRELPLLLQRLRQMPRNRIIVEPKVTVRARGVISM